MRRVLLTGGALLAAIALTACASASDWVAGARSSGASSRPSASTPSPSTRPSATPTPAGGATGPAATPTGSPAAGQATATPPPGFDRSSLSIDDPASLWVVVNKSRPLRPAAFVPPALTYAEVTYVNRQPMRPEVAAALERLFAAGHSEAGLEFSVQSAYRSYESQVRVYNDDVARNGQAFADTDTARPGHSEHQTGLAVDISAVPANCSLDACFARTPQGIWLAANAYRFGFLLRYPADKVPVTGFTFEPWHFRFVGVALSTHLHQVGVSTLEEFFGVPGGTQYR